MKNAIIYVTLFLMITSIIGACKSDEDDAVATTNNYNKKCSSKNLLIVM